MKYAIKITLAIALSSLPGLALADTDDGATGKSPTLTLLPVSHIYDPYLADQRRVTFEFQTISVDQSDLPDTGNERFGLRMGGRLELFQYQWPTEPGQVPSRLQANLEVGFRGHFDRAYSLDNIGWDGNYGLLFSYRGHASLAYRFGIYHTSSHIGDEYIERTGRERINYTREEYLAGAQYNFNPHWQIYMEGGYAYNLDIKPLQQHKRYQTGIQYRQNTSGRSATPSWFIGLDISSYEERDWDRNTSVQAGLEMNAYPHTWRLSLAYYDGQSVLGEFFQHDERYWGLSLQIDL